MKKIIISISLFIGFSAFASANGDTLVRLQEETANYSISISEMDKHYDENGKAMCKSSQSYRFGKHDIYAMGPSITLIISRMCDIPHNFIDIDLKKEKHFIEIEYTNKADTTFYDTNLILSKICQAYNCKYQFERQRKSFFTIEVLDAEKLAKFQVKKSNGSSIKYSRNKVSAKTSSLYNTSRFINYYVKERIIVEESNEKVYNMKFRFYKRMKKLNEELSSKFGFHYVPTQRKVRTLSITKNNKA